MPQVIAGRNRHRSPRSPSRRACYPPPTPQSGAQDVRSAHYDSDGEPPSPHRSPPGYPHWIEPDDRRFYVIDANHPGHASGPDHEDFQSFMTRFYEYMNKPENIARLYNALMARQKSNGLTLGR